jgi:septum formation topological specificity factor MinE
MLPISQCIHTKVMSFFNDYSEENKRRLYNVLTEELDMLLTQITMLDSTQRDEVAALQHKFKGICRYLNVENDMIKLAKNTKSELVANTLTLQQLLNDIESEI